MYKDYRADWHISVVHGCSHYHERNFYDVKTFEAVRPEHRASVAMLMAIYPDEKAVVSEIEGVGRIVNTGESGPLIFLKEW